MCGNHEWDRDVTDVGISRRAALRGGVAATAAAVAVGTGAVTAASAADDPYADPDKGALP